jgi:hypothetical protein
METDRPTSKRERIMVRKVKQEAMKTLYRTGDRSPTNNNDTKYMSFLNKD